MRRQAVPVGHGGQRVSPQRFLPLGFVLNASLWRRAVGRNGNGRDPTTVQMRCRGRRRRPRPAGPALCSVLSSHRGGTGPAAAFICLLSAGASAHAEDRQTPSHETVLAGARSLRPLDPHLQVKTHEQVHPSQTCETLTPPPPPSERF